MTYLIYRGAPVASPRALVVHHTVHRAGQPPVPVCVVMLNTPRLTDTHYTNAGRKALDTLRALGVETGNTDPLTFARRFGGPVENLTIAAEFTRAQGEDAGLLTVTYTHKHGGGQYPGTTDVLTGRGEHYALPAIDYSAPIN